MAGIDKTYVNVEEYQLIREWWIKTYKKQVREMGSALWLYPFQDLECEEVTPAELSKTTVDLEGFPTDSTFPVWNTSVSDDIWLYTNCPFDFIQARIKEQYGSDWFIFKLDKKELKKNFEPYIRIWSIQELKDDLVTTTNNILYFHKNEEGWSHYIDKAVVYGTTHIFKVIDHAKRLLQGYPIREGHSRYLIEFEYYGIKFTYKNGKTYLRSSEIETYVWINSADFWIPKFKHSYNIKDIGKLPMEAVFFSDEDECFDMSQYKDASLDKIRRYVHMLPDYVGGMIKK